MIRNPHGLHCDCYNMLMLDVKTIKQDFPILSEKIHDKPLVYLDNAATSQKPKQVIQSIVDYYQTNNANVHRGVHTLSDRATSIWEKARETIAKFVGANPSDLILTRNTTESINAVAYSWARQHLGSSDIILTTTMEHHANLVPWQEVCKFTGCELQFVGLHQDGSLDLNDLEEKLNQKQVKLLALTHVSNVTGVENPVTEIVELVRKRNKAIRILIDGAQALGRSPVNFEKLNADFYAFSGHKMLGPMGIGALLVKKELLDSNEFSPWLFGGGMISSVHQGSAEYHLDPVERFTAGTPDVASAVGLSAAIRYLQNIGLENIRQHEAELVDYAFEKLSQLQQLQVIGPRENRVGSVAFIHKKVHAHDVAQVLDSEGVAVRSGHHCCMVLHKQFAWQATVRASFHVYNSKQDIDSLVEALAKVEKVFS